MRILRISKNSVNRHPCLVIWFELTEQLVGIDFLLMGALVHKIDNLVKGADPLLVEGVIPINQNRKVLLLLLLHTFNKTQS